MTTEDKLSLALAGVILSVGMFFVGLFSGVWYYDRKIAPIFNDRIHRCESQLESGSAAPLPPDELLRQLCESQKPQKDR